jgi:hypothetical protein
LHGSFGVPMGNLVLLTRCTLLFGVAGMAAMAWRACLPPVPSDSPHHAAAGANIAGGRETDRLELRSNPFRIDRRVGPAPPKQPVSAAAPPGELVQTPRLTGIIWSTVPVAVLEGLPGAEGAVVLRQGQTAFGTTVDRIERTGVRLVSGATIWQLAMAASAGASR